MFEELPSDFDCEEVYTPPLLLPEPPLKRHEYQFHGTTVQFPYVAYPSQEDMMSKMIDGMKTCTNALLESPTGTGKTAALLCASLAWQKKQMEEFKKNNINWARRSPLKPHNSTRSPRSPIKPHNSTNSPTISETEEKIPLIIYASRTHSQLKQVVDQLKKTAYADTDMVVLASRKHFCINPDAINSSSVDDTCDKMCKAKTEVGDLKELSSPPAKKRRCSPCRALDSAGSSSSRIRTDESLPPCTYFKYYKLGDGQTSWDSYAHDFTFDRKKAPWDIEELKTFGKDKGNCPYYISKALLKSAKLILCNYNHLLHPWIRRALKLDVTNNIVIFDEAHNIESTCREIAGRVIRLESLTNEQDGIIFKLVEEMHKPDVPIEASMAFAKLQVVFQHLRDWIDNNKDRGFKYLDRKNNRNFFVKNIQDPLNEFGRAGFGPDKINELCECLKELSKTYEYEVDDEHGKILKLTYKCDAALLRSMNSLIFPFQTLFWNDGGDYNNISNYSVDLMKTIDIRKPSSTELKLHLTCLNPFVLFKDMACARSIIVTSGTLTPIDSFTSELGITFKHTLNAPHVIDSKQIWAGVITHYQDVEKGKEQEFEFKHENLYKGNDPKFDQHAHALGQLLLRICRIIPHGVLVFCTSKDFLQRLRAYWDNNKEGVLDELQKLKELFFEDKIKPSEFQNEIMRYRECAEGSPKGAMLFAVLKGSVSEGVDFADNHARAVVTIGVPYLPVTDIAVIRKRAFNKRMNETKINCSGPKYLDDKKWYRVQAYRALNQALGRCIRHKGDWGAILMVDCRCKSSENISKWVRDYMEKHGGTFDDFEMKLKTFIADRSNEMIAL